VHIPRLKAQFNASGGFHLSRVGNNSFNERANEPHQMYPKGV